MVSVILGNVYPVLSGGYRIVPDLPFLLELMRQFIPGRFGGTFFGDLIMFYVLGVGIFYSSSEVHPDEMSKAEDRLHLYLIFLGLTIAWQVYWYLAHSQIVYELPPHLADQVS
jgi:hypothetical protein